MTRISEFDLTYPIAVSRLQEYLPHQPPAIWIDWVVSLDETGGVCRVDLDPAAPYMCGDFVRPSSFVEWMAQSYGYTSVCRFIANQGRQQAAPQLAYLVGLKDFEILIADVKYRPDMKIQVSVRRTHELGPITMVEGEVKSDEGEILSRANLKLFAQ